MKNFDSCANRGEFRRAKNKGESTKMVCAIVEEESRIKSVENLSKEVLKENILIMMNSLNPERRQLLEEEFKNKVKSGFKAVYVEFYYVVLQE